MAATLRASTEGLDIVDKARCKKGWNKTSKEWADLAMTSRATLRRFWAGVAISSETFQDICFAAGIENWESITDLAEKIEHVSRSGSKRLTFAIAGSIEEIDKQKLDAIVGLLRKLGGDTSIEILDVEEGSIKLILGGSSEGLDRLKDLFESGQLANIFEISVEDVHFLEKRELLQLIRKNGGLGFNLSGVDLSDSNLAGINLVESNLIGADLSNTNLANAHLIIANLTNADLSKANLMNARLMSSNLTSADLSNAYLVNAEMSRSYALYADLSNANLRGANLSVANLIGADLSNASLMSADLSIANFLGADLSNADLTGSDLNNATLIGANLSNANFRDTTVSKARFGLGIGLSEQEKRYLVSKEAIFDSSLDTTSMLSYP